jgi:mRNA interferase MazF
VRAIHLAHLDKTRPVLVLTRDIVRPHLERVTVAPITSRVRGLSTEVPVGRANGLEHDSVVSCDNIVTIPKAALGRQVGGLLEAQERDLALAITLAFDLLT